MNNIKLILRLARPHFLVLGFLLYLVGYLLAIFYGSRPDLTRFFFGYLIFSLAHLSVSFSNDYFDRKADRNSKRTVFSGGSKVLVEHPELAPFALKIALSLLVASVIGITIFTFAFGYSKWLIVFGLVGGLTGLFYTAPPLKFAYRGLGELATMIAVGFLMPGMGYFVASGFISAFFLIWVFPLSCYGLFFIITVELPDLQSDKAANKMNWVVKWGRRKGKAISLVATTLGTISVLAIILSGLANEAKLTPTVYFSIFPLLAALTGLLFDSRDRKKLAEEITTNMLSMIFFILSINATLMLQVFSG